jgi:hypothetical protein
VSVICLCEFLDFLHQNPLIDQFRFHHFAFFAIINAIEQHRF